MHLPGVVRVQVRKKPAVEEFPKPQEGPDVIGPDKGVDLRQHLFDVERLEPVVAPLGLEGVDGPGEPGGVGGVGWEERGLCLGFGCSLGEAGGLLVGLGLGASVGPPLGEAVRLDEGTRPVGVCVGGGVRYLSIYQATNSPQARERLSILDRSTRSAIIRTFYVSYTQTHATTPHPPAVEQVLLHVVVHAAQQLGGRGRGQDGRLRRRARLQRGWGRLHHG